MAKQRAKVQRVGVKVMVLRAFKSKDDEGHERLVKKWEQYGHLQRHAEAATDLAKTLPPGTKFHIEGVRTNIEPYGDGLHFTFASDKPKEQQRRSGPVGQP